MNLQPSSNPSSSPYHHGLSLTIRFSSDAEPDLDLDVANPQRTTVVAIKHTIRKHLSDTDAGRRLRLIHGGRILSDGAVLSSVLKVIPPPPLTSPNTPNHVGVRFHGEKNRDGATGESFDDKLEEDVFTGEKKGKGKVGAGARAKEKGKGVVKAAVPRIFINCAIGDVLDASQLSAEAESATRPPDLSTPDNNQSRTGGNKTHPSSHLASHTATTTMAPRGFDRLLASGFSAAEVNALRLQFQSIHRTRYTEDTLPSPNAFRRMEDAWIDNNSGSGMDDHAGDGDNTVNPTAGTGAGGIFGANGGGAEGGEIMMSNVDALIWGVMTGFVWPLGSFGWLSRERGMHSDRWKFMVLFGVMFSFIVGLVREVAADK